MARFSMADPSVKSRDLSNNVIASSSSVASSNGSVAEGTDSDAGSQSESLGNSGRVRPGILRGLIGKRDKVKAADATVQYPSHHYQQPYPHGYPVPGHPPGMMPMQPGTLPPGMMPMQPGMMPMQPGEVPPGMMPYMMPPQYYNCAPFGGGCYEYSCGHPEIQTITVGSSCSGDYSISTSDSSCSTLLCAEPCEGLAKLVVRTLDSFSNGVHNIMDYGEELCDPVTSGGDSVVSRKSSSTLVSTHKDHVELLEKIDKLYKLVTDKEASGGATEMTKDLNPLDALNDSATTHRYGTRLMGVDYLRECSADAEDNAPGEALAEAKKEGANAEELASSFSANLIGNDQQIKVTLIQEENVVNESIEAEADFTASKKVQMQSRIVRSRSRDSCQAKEEKPTVQKEPAIDSMGFPLESCNAKIFQAISWESDFITGNPFASEGVHGVSSPVSIAASLETLSCAWCGMSGSNEKALKKLKVCSACMLTYYCSTKCQSEDWINGHAKTCQVATNVD